MLPRHICGTGGVSSSTSLVAGGCWPLSSKYMNLFDGLSHNLSQRCRILHSIQSVKCPRSLEGILSWGCFSVCMSEQSHACTCCDWGSQRQIACAILNSRYPLLFAHTCTSIGGHNNTFRPSDSAPRLQISRSSVYGRGCIAMRTELLQKTLYLEIEMSTRMQPRLYIDAWKVCN